MAICGYGMQMSDLAERLKEAAELVGGLNELAKRVDVPRRTLGNWLSGRTPKPEALKRIADATGVSLEWLITGDGRKIEEDPGFSKAMQKLLDTLPTVQQLEQEKVAAQEAFSLAMESIDKRLQQSQGLESADQIRQARHVISSYDPDADEKDEGYSHETWKPRIPGGRPEIDVRLGAGEGSVGQMLSIGSNGGMSGHRVIAEWVLPEAFMVGVMEANAARTIVMEVVGDSMQPNYQPGDRVMVDLTQTRMVADTVYAISDGFSEPQIKRLQRIPFSDPARVNIISDNPALDNFEAELAQVQIIGRICGVIARR